MSKGNFMDFIEAASEQSCPVRDELIKELYRPGVTAKDLLDLFHKYGYDGVSLEDCNKLLVIASKGDIPCRFDQKY